MVESTLRANFSEAPVRAVKEFTSITVIALVAVAPSVVIILLESDTRLTE